MKLRNVLLLGVRQMRALRRIAHLFLAFGVALNILGVATLFAQPVLQTTAYFTDSKFNPSDWVTYDIKSGNLSTTAMIAQEVESGAHGKYRKVTNWLNLKQATPPIYSNLFTVHLSQNNTLPSDCIGKIDHINFYLDSILLHGPGMAYGLAVKQGNHLFWLKRDRFIPSAAWTTVTSLEVRKEDLQYVASVSALAPIKNAPKYPDFSEHCAPLQFGFFTANSGFSQADIRAGFDNLVIEVSTAPSGYVCK